MSSSEPVAGLAASQAGRSSSTNSNLSTATTAASTTIMASGQHGKSFTASYAPSSPVRLSSHSKIVPLDQIAERLFQVICREEKILESVASATRAPSSQQQPPTTVKRTTTPAPSIGGSTGFAMKQPVKSVFAPPATSTGSGGSPPQKKVSAVPRVALLHSSPSRSVSVSGARNKGAPLARHSDPTNPNLKSSVSTRPKLVGVSSPQSSPPQGAGKRPTPVAELYDTRTPAKKQTLEDVQQLLTNLAAKNGGTSGVPDTPLNVKTPRRQNSARFKPVSARKGALHSGRRVAGSSAVKSPKLTTTSASSQLKLNRLKQRRDALKKEKASTGSLSVADGDEEYSDNVSSTGADTANTSQVPSGGRAQAASSHQEFSRQKSDVSSKMAELERLQQDNATAARRRDASRSAPNVQRNASRNGPKPSMEPLRAMESENRFAATHSTLGHSKLPVKPIWDPANPPANILPPDDRRQMAKPVTVNVAAARATAQHQTGGGTSTSYATQAYQVQKQEQFRRIASGASSMSSFSQQNQQKPAWSSSTKGVPARR